MRDKNKLCFKILNKAMICCIDCDIPNTHYIRKNKKAWKRLDKNKLCFKILNKVKFYYFCLFFIYFLWPPRQQSMIYCIDCDIPNTHYIGKNENAWKRILNDNIDIAVVLHNDVHLSPSFIQNLHFVLDSAPLNWEYLQLTTSNPLIQRHMEHIIEPWISWMPEHTSTSAYVVNRKGLGKLLKSESVIKYTSTNVIVKTQWEIEFSLKREIPKMKKTILMLSTTLIQSIVELERERNFWLIDKENVDVYKLVVVVKTQEMYDKVTGEMWDVEVVVNPDPFAKFTYYRRFLSEMEKFDYVLIKDSDQRMPPMHTMLEDDAVIIGPLRQRLDGEVDTRQWYKFQDGHLWKSDNKANFDNKLYFENIMPKEVPMLEQFFVVFDGAFAQWFFQQILTDAALLRDGKPVQSNWGPDIIWCQAAKEWNASRKPCVIIPVISQHDDTRQVVIWSSSEERAKINKQQGIRFMALFPQWVNKV